jgi:OmpA-OmpF porin, OOP family
MKNGLLFFFTVLLCGFAEAQTGEIFISGKVKEVATGKRVKARISYKSIPTGGITGSFFDSTYRFSIFGSSQYRVIATAEGYIPKVVLVDPKLLKGQTAVVKDFILTPKGQTIRLDHLLFTQGKSDIDPTSFDELNEIAAMLIENEAMVIQLEGHTDNQGNAKANMELSQDRVDAVKKYLVSKKVSKSQVKTKAFGGTQPVSKGKTPKDRDMNRRVEMRVLSEN